MYIVGIPEDLILTGQFEVIREMANIQSNRGAKHEFLSDFGFSGCGRTIL